MLRLLQRRPGGSRARLRHYRRARDRRLCQCSPNSQP